MVDTAPSEGWTLSSLTELFASDPDGLAEVDVSVSGDALRVTLMERGGLDVLIAAAGDQVLASVLMLPADDVPDRAGFERTLLTVHKLIPLSTFGITTVDGREWYELFGSLSAHSDPAAMVHEVAVLAANAVDAAEWVQEWIARGGANEEQAA